MISTEQLCSITIKNIRNESKENFAEFCALYGKSMQDALKEFVNSVFVPQRDDKSFMVIQSVNNLLSINPALVDSFLAKHEPLYLHLSEGQRSSARLIYASMNPTYLFEQYTDWLKAK